MIERVAPQDDQTQSYAMIRPPLPRWRRSVPIWRPKSWLGMAVANRIHEWRAFASSRVRRLFGRDVVWPLGTTFLPTDRPGE